MQQPSQLSGSFRGLLLFDVAESIDLGSLHRILGTNPSRREPAFRHPAPEYVRFERPPVIEQVGIRQVRSSEEVEIRIRYFDYGVASVEMQMPFRSSWNELAVLASRWIMSAELESFATSLLREALARTGPALSNPYREWISEDYYMVQLDPIRMANGTVLSAEQLLRERGGEIAQIVRGEEAPLSPTECREVLQSTMSYYPTDLLVLGWVGAFIYDNRAAAGPTFDLLEYANTQLLEFRYYDDVLTRVLADVYKRLEKRHTMWGRWRLAREAESLNTIRLDYQELVERTDTAIKFLSDMFYARMYRLAAARIGVSDYHSLVTDKLTTARDLYDSMINEFHQGRAFFLELSVVVILLIEIAFLFIRRT
jgi:hypothetical protein